MASTGERIKILRENLGLSQAEFLHVVLLVNAEAVDGLVTLL